MKKSATTQLPPPPSGPEARVRLRWDNREWVAGKRKRAVSLGRAEENDLEVDDDTVSRKHCKVVHRAGKFHLTDDSRNGTLITRGGGRTLSVHQESVLLDGAGSIRLGHPVGPEITFVVELRDPDSGAWTADGADESEAGPAAPQYLFRREGEYWTLAFEGTVLRLKDLRGLQFLSHLLQHPDEEFHALDLVLAVSDTAPPEPSSVKPWDDAGSVHVASGSGTGPVLDATAKAAYKKRLGELREDVAEAEGNNDLGRVEAAQQEIEFIAQQLSGAIGLGGRDRPAASNTERARVTVTV